jgi:hypothetical protein
MSPRVVRHGPKRFGQSRPEESQFFPVKKGKPVQQILAVRRQFNQYLTMVLITRAASHCPVFHQAIHQLHRAVMAQAKPLGKRRDAWPSSRRQPFDGEKNLMLLWFEAYGSRGFFAEMQELANPIPEFRKLAISRQRNVSVGRFRANVLIAGNH